MPNKTEFLDQFAATAVGQSILGQPPRAMAVRWLDLLCLVDPPYQTTISRYQTDLHHLLSSALPSLKIEKAKSIDSLPPVDLLLPEYKIVFEVQGPHHYAGCDFQARKGSTLLKIALLQKSGYEVIEVPVNQLLDNDIVQACIAQIKKGCRDGSG